MQTAVLETRTAAMPTAKKRSAPLDPQVADRLLDLLSSDDEYRRLFRKNPAAALEKIGGCDPSVLSSAASPIGCYNPKHIAPKREIAKARAQLKDLLTSRLAPINPHCFEAGQVSTAMNRAFKLTK